MALDIVLGSGPSGVAAASALLARGREVLMLDAGHTMDERGVMLRSRLAATEPADWQQTDIDAVTSLRRSQSLDSIRPFGSDFLFRPPDDASEWSEASSVHALRPSFAKGGLSNGWGASVTPYRQEDLADWPISIDELVPHYAAMADFMGLSTGNDALSKVFPAHQSREGHALPLSAQAGQVLERLSRRKAELTRLGVSAGQSRQAVAVGCRKCSMCLYGCPYGLIFNAADAVDRMVRSGGLTYRPGFHAIRFEERGDGVRVCSARETVSGDRLYVACGVLSTAMLSLRSLGALGQRVTLKDSQYFFLPMLQRRGSGDPSREPRHTLAQMFWEIINPDVNPQTVHVQLYTYNDTYAPDMKRRFGFLAHMLGPMTEMLSRRLIVAQGFLHSDSSHRIVLRLEGGHGSERLVYEAGQNSATASAIVRASRAVSRVGRLGGLLPLPPLLRTGSLGSSFHCGGSFPMSASPNGLDSDVLGRPGGLRRIHIVDASVFPSIPATTITFSVMANAHRIASLA